MYISRQLNIGTCTKMLVLINAWQSCCSKCSAQYILLHDYGSKILVIFFQNYNFQKE